MLREVEQQAKEINKDKEVNVITVQNLLDWIMFDNEGREHKDVVREICTWEECKKAIGKFKKGTGVGIDGWDGYLMRQSPMEIQRAYHKILQDIVSTNDFPEEWNEWIAMLAMKTDEDPREHN